MGNLFHVGHVAQLHEIQSTRLSASQPGIGPEVEELISRLTSGGVSVAKSARKHARKAKDAGTSPLSEVALRQAKVLWDLRFGEVLNLPTHEKYLKGTDAVQGIMEIQPKHPHFPDYLNTSIFVDGRVLEKVGLKEFCRLCGVNYGGNDNALVSYDERVAEHGLRWMWAQDGMRNKGIRPCVCRERFALGEVGMDAVEGLSLFVQDRGVLCRVYMDLPGSVHAAGRGGCLCLGLWSGRPELRWYWAGFAYSYCGSASRGSVAS